jgi:hypothetical protein
VPALATRGNVAVAVRTFVCVRVRVILAVAVSGVSLRPVLVAVVLVPLCGVAVTRTVVPTGMLLAVRATSTGFVVPVGNRISGAARTLPTGFAGAAIPPTLVMASVGCPAGGKTDCGKPVLAMGVVASSRMRPGAPSPA